MEEREKERSEDKWPLCINLVCIVIGLQSTKTRAELDSSTVLKQIFYEYHPCVLLTKMLNRFE